MATTRVTGRVHVASSPVVGGWVEFFPVDGTMGHLRSAPIAPDGRFVAGWVAVGKNAIRIFQPKCERPVDNRFLQFTTPIRRTIAPGQATEIDLDLDREPLRPQ
jgi:hypothetical protein